MAHEDSGLSDLRTFGDRAEAEAFIEDIAQANGGPVSIEERFLGKCRGCRGLGWLGPGAFFRCPGCVKAGQAPTPLTPSEAVYERALEAAEATMKARGYLGADLVDTFAMLTWLLEPRRTVWDRLVGDNL